MVKVVCWHDRGPQALHSLREAGRDGQVLLLALLRGNVQKTAKEHGPLKDGHDGELRRHIHRDYIDVKSPLSLEKPGS